MADCQTNLMSAGSESTSLLRVVDLHTHFAAKQRKLLSSHTSYVRAVDGVAFELQPAETIAIVGESGSGKTTLARTIVGLESPSAGEIFFRGRNPSNMSTLERTQFRQEVQMVFQDPFSSLNPRMCVFDTISEGWRIHRSIVSKTNFVARVLELLDQVGLPANALRRYPGEFSGGQRQRIGIARALALNPKIIVCDEPTSALDVSVQAQVINLLRSLQKELGLAYIFISHDLGVVAHVADKVAVMYLGKFVETGPASVLLNRPIHPYTQALLSAVPSADLDIARSNRPILLSGELPDPASPPSGCNFRTRCWKADELCAIEDPALVHKHNQVAAACHYAESLSPKSV